MPSTEAPTVPGDLSSRLRSYYLSEFPIKEICRWLRYGGDLSLREISFTLAGDIYLRWKSFETVEEFKTDLEKLQPVKIDFGAIYDQPPKFRSSTQMTLKPVQKEFCLDIDMTDYEDVMGNGLLKDATENCDRNWGYMAVAVKIIDATLREDFGFENIMWVYSGRRGIHCWVGDERARVMNNEQRIAVAEHMYLRFEGRENAGRRQHSVTNPLHPSLVRAKQICEPFFRKFVLNSDGQGMLETKERVAQMTELIPNRGVAADVREKLSHMGTGRGEEKWDKIEKELSRAAKNDYGLRPMADYIIMRYTYPRLDVNVSKEINHLLKAPFCVHPKTGRVCLPFRASDVGSFNPETMAPRLDALVHEIENKIDGKMKKLLNDGIRILEDFVQGIESEIGQKRRKQKLDELDRKGAVEIISKGI